MNAELGTAYSILERNAANMSAEEKTKFAEVLFRSGVRAMYVPFATRIILAKRKYKDIDNTIIDMAEDIGLYRFPMDCFEVADLLGIRLVAYSELHGDCKEAAFSISTDGFSLCAGSNAYTIYYNDKMLPHRILFTIWHEIGHIQAEHLGNAGQTESDYLHMEAEANHFAHTALVPTPFVVAFHPINPQEIADSFNVSLECAIYAYRTYMRITGYGGEFADRIAHERITKVLTCNLLEHKKEAQYGR